MAFPMGRYQGQMQRNLTLGEEKGHGTGLSPQLQPTNNISEGMNHAEARSLFLICHVVDKDAQ